MDLTWLGISIIILFYILCICGIGVSIKKRVYRKLIWGFLVIILGLSTYLFGGYSMSLAPQREILFFAGAFCMLISFGCIIFGLILLLFFYGKIKK